MREQESLLRKRDQGIIIDRNHGYWNDDRQSECVHCMKAGGEIALKYLEMEQEDADKLPYAENIFHWE